jgi:hypothetical protein
MDSQRTCSVLLTLWTLTRGDSYMLLHLCTGYLLTSLTCAFLDKLLLSQAVYLLLGSTLTFDTGFFCRHFLFYVQVLFDFLTVFSLYLWACAWKVTSSEPTLGVICVSVLHLVLYPVVSSVLQ